jgi:hypothetical protein
LDHRQYLDRLKYGVRKGIENKPPKAERRPVPAPLNVFENARYRLAVWTMCLRPKSKPDYDALGWCKSNNLLGVGWQLGREPLDEEEALTAFKERWSQNVAVGYHNFVSNIQHGDYCILQRGGHFYCCKIIGRWYYNRNPDAENFDLFQMRPAEWTEMPANLVPGSIRRSMIRGPACKSVDTSLLPSNYIDRLFNEFKSGSSATVGSVDGKMLSDRFSGNWSGANERGMRT